MDYAGLLSKDLPIFLTLEFGNDGMEKKMETTIMGYIGTTLRIHSSLNPIP